MAEAEQPLANNESVPRGGLYFSEQFISAAPVNQGVDILVDWLANGTLYDATREAKGRGIVTEEQAQMAQKALWLYTQTKQLVLSTEDNSLPKPDASRFPIKTPRNLEYMSTPTFRKGRLFALTEMLDEVMKLRRERQAIDYLFDQAKGSVPSAFSDAIDSIDM
jgi:hypothetical protein